MGVAKLCTKSPMLFSNGPSSVNISFCTVCQSPYHRFIHHILTLEICQRVLWAQLTFFNTLRASSQYKTLPVSTKSCIFCCKSWVIPAQRTCSPQAVHAQASADSTCREAGWSSLLLYEVLAPEIPKYSPESMSVKHSSAVRQCAEHLLIDHFLS